MASAMKPSDVPVGGKRADERLTYDVPEAGRLLGLSRNGAYAAAKAGLIPVLNVGRRMLVPKAALHQMLAAAGAEWQRARCRARSAPRHPSAGGPKPSQRERGAGSMTGPPSRSVPKLRTIDEVAELFNISRRTVQRLIRSGVLPAHRVRRAVRISDADIEVFLARNRGV